MQTGRVEIDGVPIPFTLGPRGEIFLSQDIQDKTTMIVFSYEGDLPWCYDIYILKGVPAGKQLLWHSVEHRDLNDHQRQALKGVLPRTQEVTGQ